MAKSEKPIRKTKSIIEGHLEKIGSNVFDSYSSVIKELIKGNQGIYALYKKDHLYYVGLASNLKNRINAHNKDKHQGKWTHFSLYIIRNEEHIKEIESLVLRIAYPKGNSVKGKLNHSNDLRPLLKSKLKAQWEKQYGDIIGSVKKKEALKKAIVKVGKDQRSMKGLFKGGKVIYVNYNGKDYKAWVYRNGRIKFNGELFDSPSTAGASIKKGKSTNGWRFWKYKDENGKLVYIDNLRK